MLDSFAVGHKNAAPDRAKEGGVNFTNVASEATGITYSRGRSRDFVLVEEMQDRSLETALTFEDLAYLPMSTGGYPGVAVWDYDGDEDLDIYVSNGPNVANSLLQNQWLESGTLTFIDVAEQAGVAAVDQDSAGVNYGDLDNDGDHDLIVLGRGEANRLFVNHGDGTFSESFTIGGGDRWSASSSLGDVNGDGLLDLFVGNTAQNLDAFWILVEPFGLNEANQLFLNNGDLSFTDVSASTGITQLKGLPGDFSTAATITWSVTMVDVDLDGDLDIVQTDDQGAIPPAFAGGFDRGLIHIFLNDGSGFFEDHPLIYHPNKVGSWMGVAFGDLDCNGTLDMYASNFGDYGLTPMGAPVNPLGLNASRWFLGNGDGSFEDPGVGDLVSSPFGWGAAMFDYDNDTDLDLIIHGGLDASRLMVADNPGTIMQNIGCSASFTFDFDAIPDDPHCVDQNGVPIPGCTEHIGRNVRGLALGDLDRNGFYDVVTVANIKKPVDLPLLTAPDRFEAPLDRMAFFVPIFELQEDGGFIWSGQNCRPGDLAVEVNSGNGNAWAAITLRGSIDLTGGAVTNRDAIGAVMSFTPRDGPTVTVPVTGGSSHLSQNSLERIFGLGNHERGALEVLWPGGIRNRFYGVFPGERLTIPEVPCGFNQGLSLRDYLDCYISSLTDLRAGGTIDNAMSQRLLISGIIAYFDRAR